MGANAFHVHLLVRHYEKCDQYKQAMNDKISEAAGLLRQASDMLLTVDSPSASALSEGSTESRPMLHNVTESVTRARNVIDRSRDGGTFRRLKVVTKDYGLRFPAEEPKVNQTTCATDILSFIACLYCSQFL